jgi:glycosyltransferase involved in cell wall biosynthesis
MKVLLVGTGCYEIPPKDYGAVEKIIFELSEAYKAKGHEVIVINKVIGKGILAQAKFANRALKMIKRLEYDVMHVHTNVVGFVFLLHRQKFIYTSHSRNWVKCSTLGERLGLWLEGFVAKRAVKVTAVSNLVADIMEKKVGRRPEVVPNGVNVKKYKPDYENRNGKRIVGIGELKEHKKWDLAVKAIDGLDSTLTLIGPKRDQQYYDSLQQDNVTCTGIISEGEMIDTLAKSDILVHPSVSDSFGQAVIEGMCSGLPIIASEICAEAIFMDGAGFEVRTSLSEKERVAILREKIELLMNDDGLRKNMSGRARELVTQRFSYDAVADSFLDVYAKAHQ